MEVLVVPWFVFSGNRRMAIAPGLSVVVGRDEKCDLVIDNSRISRRHLEIRADDGGWHVADISSNGTFGRTGRVTTASGKDLLILSLGSMRGPLVIISSDPDTNVDAVTAGFAVGPFDGDASSSSHVSAANITLLSGVTRFGRSLDNDVVLQGALASAHHAHVITGADGALEVVDLASFRGTFVNGIRVSRKQLTTGDRVSMGGSVFLVTESGALTPVTQSNGQPLEVRDLSVDVGAVTLLHNVSFTVPERNVVAVIGPSGSGKSTLLGALTGFSPASSGQVLVGERDLYRDYDELRFQIGLVPQADLVPAQLKVQQALDYAARLRFPRDTTRDERSARVSAVMEDLSLTSRSDLRIDRLSGGQRKRVSVALELLTQPSMLFLDEPTSGLDPGLDRQVMVLLREMADAGRTVVVVTHAVENLGLADQILILAAGGFVAYYGPPQEAPNYFNVPDLPTVFLALDTAPGEEWARRWREHQARTHSSTNSTKKTVAADTQGEPSRISKPAGTFGQFRTLTMRNAQVIFADRTYSLLLLILPLVLAVTGFLVGTADGLGQGPGDKSFLNPDARLLLMVLVLGSVFTGGATSIQELVKDRVIYQRERAVGLSRAAYVTSKALVLALISGVQGFVFAVLSLIGRPGPTDPLVLPGHLDIAVIVSLGTITACMLGLVLSALLPSRDAALPALVIATMIQVVFSGAIPLRFTWLLDAMGWMMPGYWEFEAMAASVDLDLLLGPQSSQDWPHSPLAWWTSVAVLGFMALFLVLIAIGVTGRHDPGKRRRH